MNIIKKLLFFLIITLFTQVGGIIYLLSHFFYSIIKLNKLKGYLETVRRISFHIVVYLVFTFFIIPLIAGLFGRVPLPIFSKNNLGPRTFWTVILNRHYVRPLMRETAFEIASEMGDKYPGIRINYFDANHPFFKGYPLLPHLSHNDGKKLDLGFIYNSSLDNSISSKTPSAIGYGISEEPRLGEYNRPLECSKNPKNWMYNFMYNIYPQSAKENYTFNSSLNKELIKAFVKNKNISKVLLEPHLKVRLGLNFEKVKQVQCGSVRHDDHFHVQIF